MVFDSCNLDQFLVGGFSPSVKYYTLLVSYKALKNMKVTWDDYSQYMESKSHSSGHLPVITGYKWDYTFYKWGYKYL